MFDSHCHLDFPAYELDRDAVLRRARAAGVRDVLVPAYAPRGWDSVAALGQLAGVHVALGVHPWALADLSDAGLEQALAALATRASRAGAVAIGECGLDAPRAKRGGGAAWARQVTALEAQLDVAERLGLPVVLHVVGAHGRALSLLERRGPLAAGGVLHSYSGSVELVPRYAALGLFFSFAGSVTRESARRPRQAARAVPDGRLLLESDGPDQAPRGAPSPRSEPAYLVHVCRALAAARGQSEETLARRTDDNARVLFRL